MAWIMGVSPIGGADALNGRAVKTVSQNPAGLWVLEPQQKFRAIGSTGFIGGGRLFWPGDICNLVAIEGKYLVPWQEDDVTKDEVDGLFSHDKECA